MVHLIENISPVDLGGGVIRRVMNRDQRLMVVQVDFDTGAVGAIHTHPHAQVTICASGRFRLTLGTETCEIGPGDVYYCDPMQPHGVLCLEAGRLTDVFSPRRDDFL